MVGEVVYTFDSACAPKIGFGDTDIWIAEKLNPRQRLGDHQKHEAEIMPLWNGMWCGDSHVCAGRSIFLLKKIFIKKKFIQTCLTIFHCYIQLIYGSILHQEMRQAPRDLARACQRLELLLNPPFERMIGLIQRLEEGLKARFICMCVARRERQPVPCCGPSQRLVWVHYPSLSLVGAAAREMGLYM